MPQARFHCSACSHRFTVTATNREVEEGTSPAFACPLCHSRSTERIFSFMTFLKNIFANDAERGCCGKTQSCCKKKPSSSCCCKSNANDPLSCD